MLGLLLSLSAWLFSAELSGLSSPVCSIRKDSQSALKRAGIAAYGAILKGLDSDSPEVCWRCEELLRDADKKFPLAWLRSHAIRFIRKPESITRDEVLWWAETEIRFEYMQRIILLSEIVVFEKRKPKDAIERFWMLKQSRHFLKGGSYFDFQWIEAAGIPW